MKYKYLEPTAKKAVDEANKLDKLLIMMVDGFQSDKEALILKDLLWYAREKGVEVHFAPDTSKL